MYANTQLNTYTHIYPEGGASMDITTMHPFFKDAEAIANKYQVGIQIVHHAMIVAFIAVYQHWVTVGDPRNVDNRIKISQFFVTLAASGEKKSLITDLLNKPISDYQVKLDAANQQAALNIKQEKLTWKIKRSVLLSKLKKAYQQDDDDAAELAQRLLEHDEQEPHDIAKNQLMLDGATVGGLKKSLASSSINPVVHSSEAIAFLKALAEAFATMLNRAWDGQPMAFETYNKKYDIPDPRMSLSLLTQTDVFFKHVAGNTLLQDSGFWARCLISVATPFFSHHNPRYQPEEGGAVIERIHEKLRTQLEAPVVRHLTLSNIAKDKWLYIASNIERSKTLQNTKESHTPAFAAKMPSHILRLAAVIHLAYEKGDIIDTASIEVATHLVKGFHETQLRLFTSYYNAPQFHFDAWRLHSWLIEKRSGYPFTEESTILKLGPPTSRDLTSLKCQLDYLEGEKVIYRNKNKKTSEVFLNQPFYGTPNCLY